MTMITSWKANIVKYLQNDITYGKVTETPKLFLSSNGQTCFKSGSNLRFGVKWVHVGMVLVNLLTNKSHLNDSASNYQTVYGVHLSPSRHKNNKIAATKK